ncbi:MAG: hypothetical protein K0R41_1318 [Geminicoccaceae bacterium]|jgi:uncharacterized protein GlcG (DUF336 family)|nr:hypothetical protein [Geminicoccaceae bacterium]MDF2781925.1 hypothetical protein [Geminicoccaceae bacterium]
MNLQKCLLLGALVLGGIALSPAAAFAQARCNAVPDHAELKAALTAVVDGTNAGLSNEMWATVVNRNGVVCAVVFSGDTRADQWLGSRVISAQKANTALAFSLPGDAGFGGALSSGNLYGVVQPGGSLFGLQFSNPVDTSVAYGGPSLRLGRPNDPMVGEKIGGVNVFGGGLALYNGDNLVGGLGVSGDTSCTDHIVAWRLRDEIDLDAVPGGVGDGGANDNLILANPVVPNTFQHPNCGNGGEVEIITDLATDFPIE